MPIDDIAPRALLTDARGISDDCDNAGNNNGLKHGLLLCFFAEL